jgi:hypothetical protein
MTMGSPKPPRPSWLARNKTALIVAATVLLVFHYWGPIHAYADDAASTNWLAFFLDATFSALTKFFDWAMVAGLTLVDKAAAVFLPAIPTFFKNLNWTAFVTYLSMANYWVPLDTALVVAGAFYTFQTLLIVYRFIKSWLENGW